MSSTAFTVTAPAAPTITGFSPASGYPAAAVTITGTNLFSLTSVRFNGTTAAFSVNGNGTTITTTVPAGATTGTIKVTGPGGTAVSASAFTVLQPAPNDNFVNRIIVNATASSPGTSSSNNIGATRESGEPLNTSGSGGHTVWWAWTATASGTVTIDTFTSNFDTTLGVYTGSAVNALTLVASDDDSSGVLQSSVTFAAVAGTQYQISVDGYSSNEGNITLHVTPLSPPVITSFTPISGPVGTVVTIKGYGFTSPSSVTFNGVGASFTTGAGGTEITATVPSGATTGVISVTATGGTASSANAFTVTPSSPNDSFASRITVTASAGSPATVTGNNVGASLESGETLNTTGSGGHTVWWAWTAPASGSVTIDTFGSNFDTTLGVYTGSPSTP